MKTDFKSSNMWSLSPPSNKEDKQITTPPVISALTDKGQEYHRKRNNVPQLGIVGNNCREKSGINN